MNLAVGNGNGLQDHQQAWPAVDEAATKEDSIEIPVQINGKLRDKVVVSAEASEDEIRAAQERMTYDRCSPLADQVTWLREIGFQNADSFFHSFRFAVYAGWKPES